MTITLHVMQKQFSLRRANHAIADFNATINFIQPVSAILMSEITADLTALAAELDLPATVNTQVMQFSIGPGAAPPVPMQLAGVGYQRYAPSGDIEVAVVVDNNSISVQSGTYPGWSVIFPLIVRTIARLGSKYIREVPAIRSISVQYLNEFRANLAETSSAVEIFNPNSKWLATFYAESPDLWHCHVGMFIANRPDFRTLVQVNNDVIKSRFPPKNVELVHVKNTIVVSDQFDISGQPPLIVEIASFEETISAIFARLHDVEKVIVKELFAEPYLEAMNAK